MAEHVGPMRTELGLKTGLRKLNKLEASLDEIKVEDKHDLMRANETRNLHSVGKIMINAALYRTERRNKPYHYRLDYPETNDEEWCGLVVVRKNGSNIDCGFEPVVYKSN